MCVCCVCVCFCKQLPSNQSFDKQISSHQKGGGVSRWGECVGKATAYKFDTCTLIGVHSTMHLVDPIKVHVSYTRVCVWVPEYQQPGMLSWGRWFCCLRVNHEQYQN